MASNTEKAIETYLTRRVEWLGGFTRKFVSWHRGVPDRICFINGAHFVEVKKATGKLSKLQRREIKRMREQGASVYIIKSKEDVDEFCRKVVTD